MYAKKHKNIIQLAESNIYLSWCVYLRGYLTKWMFLWKTNIKAEFIPCITVCP